VERRGVELRVVCRKRKVRRALSLFEGKAVQETKKRNVCPIGNGKGEEEYG